MDKFRFCESFVRLDRRPISFAGRPYLPAVYAAGRNLVLRNSRQTEKSTFLVNTILYEACTNPGTQILFVCPRKEQALVFVNSRLLLGIQESPLISHRLLGRRPKRPAVTNMRFANGSAVFVRAAYHSGDACRGLSANLLLVDEFQDIAEGDLPVLQETMSHAANPRTILTGTPKSVDNHLESYFRRSTANEWTVDCPGCGVPAVFDEHALGTAGLACPKCRAPLGPDAGRWVARNPEATWGDGFWVNHAMVPWLDYEEILERQRTYDIGKFKNEALGLPTTVGDHVVTRAELEACCGERPQAESREDVPEIWRGALVAGVDWGGGGASRTVLVVGYLRSDYTFEVCRFERFPSSEDPNRVLDAVAERCCRFGVSQVAADGGGNGHVYNRLLVDRLVGRGGLRWLTAVFYGAVDQEPRMDGVLLKWTVGRSPSIGVLLSRVKKGQVVFPRLADSSSYLDEFACETAEYDDVNRTVRYSHPESQQDDALHATNYALLAALRAHGLATRYAF